GANRMYFSYVFCGSHKVGHRAKRISLKIHIQSSNNNTNPTIGKVVAYLNNFIVKKLCFVYSHYLTSASQQRNICCGRNGRRVNFIAVVRHYHVLVITSIYHGFEYLHLLICKASAF